MDVAELLEIEAIRRLKYRYMRCVDQKRWDELADCFTEDAKVAYADGTFSFQGREAIMEFLTNGLASVRSIHTAHHPEIELTSDTTARGIWSLEDTVLDPQSGTGLHGTGFYSDTYVKTDGAWKITSTGYTRTFEDRTPMAAND